MRIYDSFLKRDLSASPIDGLTQNDLDIDIDLRITRLGDIRKFYRLV